MVKYPLEGYRVTDFTWVWAGPNLTAILADMGAEVIKVETRKHIDSARLTPTPARESPDPEMDCRFHSINRNKLGITVDISEPRGAALIKELVKISDMAVENFAPRVLKKHGLDYESLREVNPQIVMISLPAAGQYGPLRDVTTYAPSLGALSGLSSLVGYYGERVLGEQTGYLDINSSIHGAFAVLAALYYRQRTGKGQYIDMAQLEVATFCLGEAVMDYTMNGRVPDTQGNRHSTMAPHNNYPCQGGDKWVSIAIKTDEEWQALCRALGNPLWSGDEKFSDGFNRQRNRDELDSLLSECTLKHTDYEVTEALQQVGVAAAPCLDTKRCFFDPHFKEREAYLMLPHPAIGTEAIAGLAFKLSDTPSEIRLHAPLLGQHNDYVFRELLGMSEEEIAQLTEDKVIY